MESTPTTTNPLGSDAGSNGGRSELEGALKGLQDGSLSDQEAAAVMERMMDARVSDLRTELGLGSAGGPANGGGDIAALRSELAAGGSESSKGPQWGLVRRVLARLEESPTNWHQGTVFAFARQDAEPEMARRARILLAGSFAIVLLQCWTAVAIFTGTVFQACQTSDQCRPGQYCQVGEFAAGDLAAPGAGRCAFCGGRPPLEVQLDLSGATLNVRQTSPFRTILACLVFHRPSTSLAGARYRDALLQPVAAR